MKLLNKMERKFGHLAIRNLTLYIIATYILGYILEFAGGNLTTYLYLDPYYILHGQIWRLVSWLLVPPSSLNIFTVIMLFFYYSIGTSLENTWGTFRYNVYIFGGILWTVIGAFILYGILWIMYGQQVAFGMFGSAFSTYYISLSIFLGFAMTYPDMQVMLYFIIPLKIKYLAWLDLGAYVRPDQMVDVVEGKCGLAVDYGSWFGGNAATHIRVNLATRPENIRQAADALAEHL